MNVISSENLAITSELSSVDQGDDNLKRLYTPNQLYSKDPNEILVQFEGDF